MSKRKNYIILLAMMLLTACTFRLYAQTPSAANQVKAVFIYNFTQFVEWPSASFANSTSPFVIGILGTDPFGSYIDSVITGEKFGSHPIVIHRFNTIPDVKACHILFLHSGQYSAIKELQNKAILTVGDEDSFILSGGMIRFFIANNKIRLQINLKAARAANLTISSKLLRVADVIN